eukprot:CAMPEP_0195514266 /NCGR_PEP_ID=MMETSP0794_2-20130614/5704_1 /TAXON_ID=515487 /ORGANISM="Stephanopyxis turris, Strain CCMP 815" /LENGTH=502 /DNA_ID=CAMNT_0040642469 /DNA_START=964 /DNA_END=2472 /DNA_ORIENTATION=+
MKDTNRQIQKQSPEEHPKSMNIEDADENEQADAYEVENEEDLPLLKSVHDDRASSRTLLNFVLMSILFSANHGCSVACLSLATARLGTLGAWQSVLLFVVYTASAVLGATYVVKQLGARNAMITGMVMYCMYVLSFIATTSWSGFDKASATLGAIVGGMGGGIKWTSQGAYFCQGSEEYAEQRKISNTDSTSFFASIFASIYLLEEAAIKFMPTILIAEEGMSWKSIYGVYSTIAVLATIGMCAVRDYPVTGESSTCTDNSLLYKVTAAWQLLRKDPKMKYMIGLNSVFGFAGAFLNSYVNGEVIRIALHDEKSQYVGALSSVVAIVAGVMSLVFGSVAQRVGKGPILVLGAVVFFFVAFPFLLQPNLESWGMKSLIPIYALHGIGRATFEGTLKATFADYFPYEKEGAFANITLQNGFSSTIGYMLTFLLTCSKASAYCVEYKDGSLHDVLSFELFVCISALVAIWSYWKASALFQIETARGNRGVEMRAGSFDFDNELYL